MISVEPATRPSLRLASDQQIFQAKDWPLSGPSQTCVYAYVKTTRHLYYEMYGWDKQCLCLKDSGSLPQREASLELPSWPSLVAKPLTMPKPCAVYIVNKRPDVLASSPRIQTLSP